MNCTPPFAPGACPSSPRSIDFDAWYREHRESIYHFVLHRVDSHEDAEDILQATYLGAWEHRASYRGTARPTTWLIAIALDLLRRETSRASDLGCIVEPIRDDTEPLVDARFPERTVDVRQRFVLFLEFAQSLSTEQQRMLELIFVDNMNYVQAAAMIGVPVGTIRSRLSRLRAKLEQHCGRPD